MSVLLPKSTPRAERTPLALLYPECSRRTAQPSTRKGVWCWFFLDLRANNISIDSSERGEGGKDVWSTIGLRDYLHGL